MEKNKILVSIGVGLVSLFLLFLVVRGLFSNENAGQNSQNIPLYTLTQAEEVRLLGFVQNIISLYNSYSTDDTSNLTALGDFMTINMQRKVTQRVEVISSSPDFLTVRGEAKPGTFRYTYSQGSELSAFMDVEVRETNAETSAVKSNTLHCSLLLLRDSTRWIVDDVNCLPGSLQ